MILSTQKIVNQLIRLLHFRPDIPTRNGGLDRKHKDPGLGQLGMHDLNELLNVLRDALRGLTIPTPAQIRWRGIRETQFQESRDRERPTAARPCKTDDRVCLT